MPRPPFRPRGVLVAAYVAALFVAPLVLAGGAPGWVRTAVAVVMVGVPVLWLVRVGVALVRLVRQDRANGGRGGGPTDGGR